MGVFRSLFFAQFRHSTCNVGVIGSVGDWRRSLPRHQSKKKIIFHFLEWHWNPKLAVFAFTRLCPCATTGLNGLMTCDLYFFKATQHTSANISFCFFKYIFLKFKLFHFMYNVNGLNVINNFILHKKRNIISDRFLYNYNFFNATINLN